MNQQKIIQIQKDIMDIQKEINRVESGLGLDRNMAIALISKHNASDTIVDTYNSPLNKNYIPFDYADNRALYNNLKQIQDYLKVKLLKEGTSNE